MDFARPGTGNSLTDDIAASREELSLMYADEVFRHDHALAQLAHELDARAKEDKKSQWLSHQQRYAPVLESWRVVADINRCHDLKRSFLKRFGMLFNPTIVNDPQKLDELNHQLRAHMITVANAIHEVRWLANERRLPEHRLSLEEAEQAIITHRGSRSFSRQHGTQLSLPIDGISIVSEAPIVDKDGNFNGTTKIGDVTIGLHHSAKDRN